MDLNRFVADREPGWKELELLLDRLGEGARGKLSREDVRRVVKLYRQASSDLIEARHELGNAALLEYLNALVGRAYAALYTASGLDPRAITRFFTRGFPVLLRGRAGYVLAAAAVFAAGMAVGLLGVALDPDARDWLIPAQHRDLDPAARVRDLESATADGGAAESAAFSSFLFTHNIRVAFTAFALGVTLGLGTVVVLFANGVMLGALAADYHLGGEGTFFWAWILPHGVPEIGSILVAGGAGLLLGKSLLFPGDLSLRQSFARSGGEAVLLVLGTLPVFVLAGLVEGSISQVHAPRLPYALKLGFAGLEAALLVLWLRRGREEEQPPGESRLP